MGPRTADPVSKLPKNVENLLFLVSRLQNWKFHSAVTVLESRFPATEPEYMELVPQGIRDVIYALQSQYGNSGCFEGTMGEIVNFTVDSLITDLSKR